jgi:hypothetical protein
MLDLQSRHGSVDLGKAQSLSVHVHEGDPRIPKSPSHRYPARSGPRTHVDDASWRTGRRQMLFDEADEPIGVGPEEDRAHIVGGECGMDKQIVAQARDAYPASQPAIVDALDRACSLQQRE